MFSFMMESPWGVVVCVAILTLLLVGVALKNIDWQQFSVAMQQKKGER